MPRLRFERKIAAHRAQRQACASSANRQRAKSALRTQRQVCASSANQQRAKPAHRAQCQVCASSAKSPAHRAQITCAQNRAQLHGEHRKSCQNFWICIFRICMFGSDIVITICMVLEIFSKRFQLSTPNFSGKAPRPQSLSALCTTRLPALVYATACFLIKPLREET